MSHPPHLTEKFRTLTGVVPSGISMGRRVAKARSAIAAAAALLLLDPATVAAPSQDAQPAFGEQISVGYVLVPVVVRGRAGRIDDLDRDDFRLRVDGEPVEIDSFESGALAPVGILFLQDLSGSMGIGDKLDWSRALVRCMLRRRIEGDEFAIAGFSDRKLFVEVPFPGSEEAVREAIAAWSGYGRTALHDAVAWLPDLVHARVSPRRAVVLVTDGVDNASLVEPGEARDDARQAEVPVHVVGLETGSPFRIDREGNKVFRLADTLNLIAWATGGGYHSVASRSQLEAACAAIVSTLRHQYVLGFATSGAGDSGHREIDVEVAAGGRDLDIRFRRSYRGTRPTTMTSKP